MRQAIFLAVTLAMVSWCRPLGQTNRKRRTPPTTAPQAAVFDAASAFEFLKTLTGEWERSASDHDHGSNSRSVNLQSHGGRKLGHGDDLSGRRHAK